MPSRKAAGSTRRAAIGSLCIQSSSSSKFAECAQQRVPSFQSERQGGSQWRSSFSRSQVVRIEALSLNFFDVVKRLGIMPSHVAGQVVPEALPGHDFAGQNTENFEEILGLGAPGLSSRADF